MPRKPSTEKKFSTKKMSGRTKTSQTNVLEGNKDVPPSIAEQQPMLNAIENNYRQILEMQDRILSAPAMNGGFTTLLYKVENIEQSQEKLVEKVDQIHEVLYEPDNGLYARIKNVENDCVSGETLENLEKDIQDIKYWKDSEVKFAEKEEKHLTENDKLLKDHDDSIKELQKSIDKFNKLSKWVVATVGGGFVSMLIKIIHDYVVSHVHFT